MKKIILALTIMAFTAAVQAGESCCMDKAACAGKEKVACAGMDKAACAGKEKSTCTAKAISMKAGCSAKKECPKAAARKKWLMRPKAAGELAMAN